MSNFIEQRKATFDPSQALLYAWLATRKQGSSIGSDFPGLFSTHKFYSLDLPAFVGVIFIEILGLIAMTLFGALGFFGGILGLIFMIFDILFAILLHRSAKFECWVKNETVLSSNESKKAALEDYLKKKKAQNILWGGLIIIFAVTKVFIFFLGYGVIDVIGIAICLAYIVAAFLHISCTGYWWAEVDLNRRAKSEHSKAVAKGITIAPRTHEIFVNARLRPVQTATHKLEDAPVYFERNGVLTPLRLFNQAGTQFFRYKLITKGLLSDSDLATLAFAQPGQTESSALAKELFRIQMTRVLLQAPDDVPEALKVRDYSPASSIYVDVDGNGTPDAGEEYALFINNNPSQLIP